MIITGCEILRTPWVQSWGRGIVKGSGRASARYWSLLIVLLNHCIIMMSLYHYINHYIVIIISQCQVLIPLNSIAKSLYKPITLYNHYDIISLYNHYIVIITSQCQVLIPFNSIVKSLYCNHYDNQHHHEHHEHWLWCHGPEWLLNSFLGIGPSEKRQKVVVYGNNNNNHNNHHYHNYIDVHSLRFIEAETVRIIIWTTVGILCPVKNISA